MSFKLFVVSNLKNDYKRKREYYVGSKSYENYRTLSADASVEKLLLVS